MRNPKLEFARYRLQGGFTLLEIMIVVVIIGIIAGFAIVNLVGTSEGAKKDLSKAFVKGSLSTQITLYQLHNNSYPTSIEALVSRPSDASNWRGPYLNELPRDPWGEPYVIRVPGTHNTERFDVFSKGPDKQEGTGDDIGNWSDAAAGQ